MKTIIINGNEYKTEENLTILELARENGIYIPALCFLKDCGNVSKCAVCRVEVEFDGKVRMSVACNTKIEDGMIIHTDSPKVQEMVKTRVSQLLDAHEFKCGPCPRRIDCEFLKIVIKTKAKANKVFIPENRSENIDDRSKSIVIDRNKCVLCGRCEATCKTKTGTNSIKIQKIDGARKVAPSQEDKCLDESGCILCGQCVNACPVAALKEKSHMDRVKEALEDKDKHVIVAMAPSVRTAVGEMFKMGYGADVTGKLYTAMRILGFNRIFDINFGADMTIMEEATEFISRLREGGPFPMFTSCCSSWVKMAEDYYPEILDNLSTAKSPQQEFGAASKSYYPEVSGVKAEDVFTVTIMPCTSKKYEADREEMQNDGLRNIDAVLTTREFVQMIREKKINFSSLEDSEADPAMGEYTGAGTIFGATGGVMEAALRTTKDFAEGKELGNIDYTEVRGLDGIKEATVNIGGTDLKVAVINGAANVFELFQSGKVKDYHFIEVMACSGGCVNGGGQPHVNNMDRMDIDVRKLRASVLYNQDKNLARRKSHENVALLKMYETFMGKPGEEKAHKYLHHKYKAKR